jgi:hypothetical protein
MKPCGVAHIAVSHNAQMENLNLYVVPVEGLTLFGREWLQQISLDRPTIKSLMSATDKISDTCSSSANLRLKDMLTEHETVFNTDIGKVKGIEAQLKIGG